MEKLKAALDVLSKTLVTDKFLMEVEKWARFDGKKPLCDGDKVVPN